MNGSPICERRENELLRQIGGISARLSEARARAGASLSAAVLRELGRPAHGAGAI